MWKKMEFGTPGDEMENLIKDVQQDIKRMYELADIAKYINKQKVETPHP
ncbi:MAG: hypothetical protein WD824_20560 [Cyclobacteriaceae bacterium]